MVGAHTPAPVWTHVLKFAFSFWQFLALLSRQRCAAAVSHGHHPSPHGGGRCRGGGGGFHRAGPARLPGCRSSPRPPQEVRQASPPTCQGHARGGRHPQRRASCQQTVRAGVAHAQPNLPPAFRPAPLTRPPLFLAPHPRSFTIRNEAHSGSGVGQPPDRWSSHAPNRAAFARLAPHLAHPLPVSPPARPASSSTSSSAIQPRQGLPLAQRGAYPTGPVSILPPAAPKACLAAAPGAVSTQPSAVPKACPAAAPGAVRLERHMLRNAIFDHG